MHTESCLKDFTHLRRRVLDVVFGVLRRLRRLLHHTSRLVRLSRDGRLILRLLALGIITLRSRRSRCTLRFNLRTPRRRDGSSRLLLLGIALRVSGVCRRSPCRLVVHGLLLFLLRRSAIGSLWCALCSDRCNALIGYRSNIEEHIH